MTLQEKMAVQVVEQQKVRGDLMILSGQVGHNKPYRAPIYLSYAECIKGLYRQGILGFYKGNGCRIAHIFAYDYFRNDIVYQLDYGERILQRSSFWRDFIAATAASIMVHPLHFAAGALPNYTPYCNW